MDWLTLCLIAAVLYTISSFVDNYIVDNFFKDRTPEALKIIDGPALLTIAILILIFNDVQDMPIMAIVFCLASGFIRAFADIPYHLGLCGEETTGTTILFQLSPIFYLAADYLIFHQTINNTQILGFLFILATPAIIVFDYYHHRQGRKMRTRAALWIMLSVLIYTLGDLLFARGNQNCDYMSMYFYYLLGHGLIDCIISLGKKKWQKRFVTVFKREGLKFPAVFIINVIMYTIAGFVYRYAISHYTGAIISVTYNASQLLITFILGIILSFLWPRFGREKNDKRTICTHLIATIFAIIGIVILQ